MIFKRYKNLPFLPINPRGVTKMVGLKSSPDAPPIMSSGFGNDTNNGLQGDVMNDTGNDSNHFTLGAEILEFDGNFECANID